MKEVDDGLSAGTSTVRSKAMEAVYNVMEKGAYANIEIDKVLRKTHLSLSDRNLFTEIVNGCVRMVKHLDWVLDLFLHTGVDKQNPWLRNILRVSLYQLLFMDRIPEYAVVNDAVEIADKKIGKSLARVTNGVLRNIIRNRDKIKYPQGNRVEYLAVFYSHPQWLVEKLLQSFGFEDTKKILSYNNRRPAVVLRNNSLKITRDELVRELQDEGIKCAASALSPWGIKIESMPVPIAESRAYQEGFFYIQNEASMLAAPILNPQKGDLVCDLCAGVGGKTTHLAEFMDNRGKIKAFDIYSKKLDLLEQNCVRLGINIVETHCQNVLDINERLEAQRVLLDAPCSGLGVLNRRADLRWRKTRADIKRLRDLQASLLRKAGEMVAKDGLLLYSTCTVNREENEDAVLDFINGCNGTFVLQGFAEEIAFFPLDSTDKKKADEGMLTVMPGKYGSDGMFYALMRRKTDNWYGNT